jgi:hypothetical protein
LESRAHFFLANMGGFAIEFVEARSTRETPATQGLGQRSPSAEDVSGSMTATATDCIERNGPEVKSVTAVASSAIMHPPSLFPPHSQHSIS